MLFPYEFMPHKMDKMQTFIDYIFYDVWCSAPTGKPFDFSLFGGSPELKEVMEIFFYSDTQGGDFFYGHVERIYGLFANLTPAKITQLKKWYCDNNNIEQACANNPALQLVKYSDLIGLDEVLIGQLKVFYKGLYSKSLLNLKALKDKIGDINEHFEQFRQANKAGKCPFCGINDLKGTHHSKREAYDHYLPKGLYPFNSINFRNLAPACHECNSTYKLLKDPIHCTAGARKAFYPYSTVGYTIDLEIQLSHNNWQSIQPDDIQLTFGSVLHQEEINTWKSVYGIEERYKAKCCSEDDGKEWIVQILDEWKEDDRLPEEFISTLVRQTRQRPYSDLKFLKKAFLEGCDRAGLFNDTAEGV